MHGLVRIRQGRAGREHDVCGLFRPSVRLVVLGPWISPVNAPVHINPMAETSAAAQTVHQETCGQVTKLCTQNSAATLSEKLP